MEHSVSELTNLLRKWENEMLTLNYNPIPTLIKLCELFEAKSKIYHENDSVPSDNCQTSQLDSTCVLDQMYEILINNNSLMTKLVIYYLKEQYWPKQNKDNHDLNVAACRLIINLIPGLETTLVFQSLANDQVIQRLYTLAENTNKVLQTYATRLLAFYLEFPETDANYIGQNNKLVPIVLDRLHSYYTQFCEENQINQSTQPYKITNNDQPNDDIGAASPKGKEREENCFCGDGYSSSRESNASNWIQVYPPNLITKLVYCLKYLEHTGEHEKFLRYAYEKNALNIVIKIINSSEKQNDYLTFRALKYLAALLYHKEIATKFIDLQGLQNLLQIPKSSISSHGVSICLFCLSHWEEAMEKICLLPKHDLVHLVKYVLWMLECFNDASKCYGIVFFQFGLHYSVIKEIFDDHDGLRKMLNMVSELPTFSSEYPAISSFTQFLDKKIINYFCIALKHYFEAHLHIKAQQIRREKTSDSALVISSTILHNFFTEPDYKSTKKSHAEVQEEIELLLNYMYLKNNWRPIDQFFELGGLSKLLQIISLGLTNNSLIKRPEIIKNALGILNICAVLPKIQLALCEITVSDIPAHNQNDTTLEEDNSVTKNDKDGLKIIIDAAEIPLNADIKKAALSIIITCVCAPTHSEGENIVCYSSCGSNNKQSPRTYDDAVIEKIWNCFRNNNGITVLLSFMTIKSPTTDVDAMRGLASRALAGLARNESIRQIFGKLPLFNSGQLQSMMKNPVLQEKRHEHVTFQKYATELLELTLGSKNIYGPAIEASMANINQANVIEQTKNNLICQYFMKNYFSKTAEIFIQEANLNITDLNFSSFTYASHCQSIEGGTSTISTIDTIQNQKPELANSSNSQDLTLLSDNNTNSEISLESVLTEYLTNRHPSNKHPTVTCPQLNLFIPQKCPDLKPRSSMCTNFAMRFSKNIHSRKLNQRLIHSRFCPTHNFNMDDENAYFTSCEFLSLNRVAVGTNNGVIKVFNLFTSQEELSFSTPGFSYVNHLQCSNDKRLLISSSILQQTASTNIWSICKDAINIRYSLDHEEFCTFSNYDQNKILGTNAKITTIYDVESSKRILRLVPKYSNQYSRNQAVFNSTNKLVLSDGVLWDAIAGKEIHKFDKLNQYMNGVFHPNALEIISNNEIWDMRTFKLLRTVSSLDNCKVTFSKSGEGMYLYVLFHHGDVLNYQPFFKTLDPNDYSNIATVDIDKSIYHIACNSDDTQIAIVENQGIFDDIDESIVRIYDVGRSRKEDEE